MSKKIHTNQKHMNHDDHVVIEKGLDNYEPMSTIQREYKTVLVESRTGINISEENLKTLDATVSPLVKQGQSIYMILQNHPEITQC